MGRGYQKIVQCLNRALGKGSQQRDPWVKNYMKWKRIVKMSEKNAAQAKKRPFVKSFRQVRTHLVCFKKSKIANDIEQSEQGAKSRRLFFKEG